MRKMYKQASLTVEAVLVMILVLGVICFIIYEGLFMYDRCIMKGAAYEGAVLSSNIEAVNERVNTGTIVNEVEKRAGTVFFADPSYTVNKKNGTWTVSASASRGTEKSSIMRMVLDRSCFAVDMKSTCYSPNRERIIRSTNAALKIKDKGDGNGN